MKSTPGNAVLHLEAWGAARRLKHHIYMQKGPVFVVLDAGDDPGKFTPEHLELLEELLVHVRAAVRGVEA